MIPITVLDSICTLLMCDDPSNLPPEARTALMNWAGSQAQEHGFKNWLAIYHRY